MNGIIMLFVYAAIMILATVTMTKKEKNVVNFCVGSRSENWILSALSIAATWIWAPALFVSTEKAYSAGWIGLFWFLVPNALCLVIFIPFAKRIRKEMEHRRINLSGRLKRRQNHHNNRKQNNRRNNRHANDPDDMISFFLFHVCSS